MDAQGLEWRAAGDLPAGSAGIARLAARIEASAVVLSAEAAERGITMALGREPAGQPRVPRRQTADHLAWFESVVWSSRLRLVEIKAALEAFGRMERPGDAEARVVRYLADLTPLRVQLVRLSLRDPRRAMEETARQLDALDVHLASAAALLGDPGLADVPDEEADSGVVEAPDDGAATFERISAETPRPRRRGHVAPRGGGCARHVQAGLAQAHTRRDGARHDARAGDRRAAGPIRRRRWQGRFPAGHPGGARRVSGGRGAGMGTLRFLVEQDPNLGRTPIDALRDGRIGAVVQAARAHLGLDEG